MIVGFTRRRLGGFGRATKIIFSCSTFRSPRLDRSDGAQMPDEMSRIEIGRAG